MISERKEQRRRDIEAAAYEVLADKGYKAASMLAIAKKASASNETLYKWYGNKQSLFQTLVEENARDVRELLEKTLAMNADPLETIHKLGPILLSLVTSQKAVVLNQAAAGDVFETNTLGKTIASAGKEAVAPLLNAVILKAREHGQICFDNVEDIADIYTSLLIGDIQIQRVIGVRKPLSRKEISYRAERAFQIMLQLYGSDKKA